MCNDKLLWGMLNANGGNLMSLDYNKKVLMLVALAIYLLYKVMGG